MCEVMRASHRGGITVGSKKSLIIGDKPANGQMPDHHNI